MRHWLAQLKHVQVGRNKILFSYKVHLSCFQFGTCGVSGFTKQAAPAPESRTDTDSANMSTALPLTLPSVSWNSLGSE